MVGENPAIHSTGTQNRQPTFNKSRRYYRNRMDRKRSNSSRRFCLGSATGSTIPDNPCWIQNGARKYQNQRLNPVIYRTLPSKTKYYHNRGDFFWEKQSEKETSEEFWRRIIEIEKECDFDTISAEELLISKYNTAVTDEKLQDKLIKEETLEMKETFEMIKKHLWKKKTRKTKSLKL